jgi:heptosyltransferase-1
MAEQRFLVVRLGSLGDIVHTFPAVSALRESFPRAEIIWLTQQRWKPLVASSGLASRIWVTDTRKLSASVKTIREIRARRFAAAIDYQGLWKSASLPFLARVPRRIGFSAESIREAGVPLLYTETVQALSAHVADQNGELSRLAGARNPVAPFSLHVSPVGDDALFKFLRSRNVDRYVVLSPGGGWRSKCWPAERFGALCQLIASSRGCACVVNYGPGEEDLAAQVRSSSGPGEPLLFNGEIGPLMSLLRNAICVVGGDTGPLHLAAGLATPVIALFGPTDPVRNGPYHVPEAGSVSTSAGTTIGKNARAKPATSNNTRDIVLRAPNVVTTHSRSEITHPSMLELQVDEVFDAVRRTLQACQ